MMISVSPVQAATAAMAVAVLVLASAHVAAMAVPEVLVLTQDVMKTKVQIKALPAVVVMPVLPLAPWALSMWSSPPSICLPRAALQAPPAVVVHVAITQLKTLITIMLLPAAVAAVLVASVALPLTSALVVPAVAAVAAVPRVTAHGELMLLMVSTV